MSKNESIECGAAHCGGCAPAAVEKVAPLALAGARLFRIKTMDCAVEEAEIRRALEPVAGIQGLSFQLGARTLGITAPAPVIEQALAAIRHVGFDPQPLTVATAEAAGEGAIGNGLAPLLIALALALAAEAVAFLATPDLATTAIEMLLGGMPPQFETLTREERADIFLDVVEEEISRVRW